MWGNVYALNQILIKHTKSRGGGGEEERYKWFVNSGDNTMIINKS